MTHHQVNMLMPGDVVTWTSPVTGVSREVKIRSIAHSADNVAIHEVDGSVLNCKVSELD